jgi:hypothetical protein
MEKKEMKEEDTDKLSAEVVERIRAEIAEDDDPTINLEISMTVGHSDGDPERYVNPIHCTIEAWGTELDGGGGDYVEVGSIYAHLARFDEGGEVCSLYDLLDAPAAETAFFLELFSMDEDEPYATLTKDAARALAPHGGGEDLCNRLLMLQTVHVNKRFRGLGLGLLAVHRLMHAFLLIDMGSIAALKPFPLQYTGKVTEENKKEFLAAQDTLRRYWARLGFRTVHDSELMILSLAMKQPTPKQFLKKRCRATRRNKQ